MLKKLRFTCKTVQPTFIRRLLCTKKSDRINPELLATLEEGYKKLVASNSKSLLKKHLTQPIFDKLKTLTTPTFHSTLFDCIQSGLANHDSGVGIYAPDPEAYVTFADLFDPVIEDYHGGFKKSDKHPPLDFGNFKDFCNLDPDNCFIVSTRIRCARSVECFPFNPCMSEYDYKDLERKITQALCSLKGEHSGEYLSLCDMDKSTQQKLIDDHFLFKEGDRFLQAANASRFWPAGRGIFYNKKKNFLVWCNEEDHLRVIAMDKGGDLGKIYMRMAQGAQLLAEQLKFSRDERFGFLTFCPTNLGTTIRASVHIRLPKLASDTKKLEEVASKYQLQVRGTRGEHTKAEGGVYDISNKRRLGLTEYKAVAIMQEGILELIAAEKKISTKPN